MPFEWECRKCLSVLELQDAPEGRVSCPECGSFAMSYTEVANLTIHQRLDRIVENLTNLNRRFDEALETEDDEGPGLRETLH